MDFDLQLLAALLAIGGAVLGIIKWGKGVPRKIWNWLNLYRSGVPRDTMRIVPKPSGMWWHMGGRNNEPAMQVVSRWHVTNITNDQLLILGARIMRPRAECRPLIEHPEGRHYLGSFPILPGDPWWVPIFGFNPLYGKRVRPSKQESS